MNASAVYDVSGSDDSYRCYLLRDDTNVLSFTEQDWGTSLRETWNPPDIEPFKRSLSRPDADFRALYLPGLIMASEAASEFILFPELERLRVRMGSEDRFLLNPLITVRRFRESGAKVWRLPTGPVLQIDVADFFAQDIPALPRIFWFYDGRFARFLLCNEPFRALVQRAGFTGVSFKWLGNAK